MRPRYLLILKPGMADIVVILMGWSKRMRPEVFGTEAGIRDLNLGGENDGGLWFSRLVVRERTMGSVPVEEPISGEDLDGIKSGSIIGSSRNVENDEERPLMGPRGGLWWALEDEEEDEEEGGIARELKIEESSSEEDIEEAGR
jgi:hypothetical protein